MSYGVSQSPSNKTNSDFFDTYYDGRSEFKLPVCSVSRSNLTHVVPTCYFKAFEWKFYSNRKCIKIQSLIFQWCNSI